MSAETDKPIAVDRLGAGRHVDSITAPPQVGLTVHQLSTFDGATIEGVLHRLPGSETVVTLMHPRQSVTHHPIIPLLLHAGVSVWTQTSRSVNNDIALVHEQALLDAAAGMCFLRDNGFTSLVTFGHSGGGTLYAFYIEQAALAPERRIDVTPAARPIALAGAELPLPDGAIFLAPHPGQGQVLSTCIDPSVTDENDPMSCDPDLDMYHPANGFRTPPEPSCFSAEFLARYRGAQRDRIARIDEHARELAAEATQARVRFAASGDPDDRRRSLAPRILTTYRTDADPRYIDLAIDPNDRHYGSLFGRRPDLINYGLVGFGRLTTPDAWLSTWSVNTTNADFVRCAAGVHVPSVFIEFSGDSAAFPSDSQRMYEALASTDKSRHTVRGQHFGQPLSKGEPTGYAAAADHIAEWLNARGFTARGPLAG
ncbi:alpha/beta hydrolase [[Mycobacterium] crassicus]|uniref:Alpha/beta hydrolase n=1 Tax=[Mycobacterium] crassicus TaxID=2872309 RepID=A0ABU5XLR2_9MYCO|nr:alpha/beta hydrolase [Mycolicibacter sp. MYC098]MEB3023139.1 alpha/beta hydrolase [Mycolicibacter sp. MYC098]